MPQLEHKIVDTACQTSLSGRNKSKQFWARSSVSSISTYPPKIAHMTEQCHVLLAIRYHNLDCPQAAGSHVSETHLTMDRAADVCQRKCCCATVRCVCVVIFCATVPCTFIDLKRKDVTLAPKSLNRVPKPIQAAASFDVLVDVTRSLVRLISVASVLYLRTCCGASALTRSWSLHLCSSVSQAWEDSADVLSYRREICQWLSAARLHMSCCVF